MSLDTPSLRGIVASVYTARRPPLDDDPHSLLSVYLWDLRASVEAQLRCLTTIGRAFDAFRKETNVARKRNYAAQILDDLKEVQHNNATIAHIIDYTVAQAKVEVAAL